MLAKFNRIPARVIISIVGYCEFECHSIPAPLTAWKAHSRNNLPCVEQG